MMKTEFLKERSSNEKEGFPAVHMCGVWVWMVKVAEFPERLPFVFYNPAICKECTIVCTELGDDK